MRLPHFLVLFLLPGFLACGDPAAPAEAPLAFLQRTFDELRDAARQHDELLEGVGLPLLPCDAECDALFADFRAVLEPAMLPGVIDDWEDLVVRMGLVSLFFQLCPEGELIYGQPRAFRGPDGAAGARIRVEYPSAAGDPERHDLVLLETAGGWRMCRRPLLADRPEEEVELALGMGLLPCAAGASEELKDTIAALADARPTLRLLERDEDGPSLRLRVEVEAGVLDGPFQFTAVHELPGWAAHP